MRFVASYCGDEILGFGNGIYGLLDSIMDLKMLAAHLYRLSAVILGEDARNVHEQPTVVLGYTQTVSQ